MERRVGTDTNTTKNLYTSCSRSKHTLWQLLNARRSKDVTGKVKDKPTRQPKFAVDDLHAKTNRAIINPKEANCRDNMAEHKVDILEDARSARCGPETDYIEVGSLIKMCFGAAGSDVQE
jgi:hypothetical protein